MVIGVKILKVVSKTNTQNNCVSLTTVLRIGCHMQRKKTYLSTWNKFFQVQARKNFWGAGQVWRQRIAYQRKINGRILRGGATGEDSESDDRFARTVLRLIEQNYEVLRFIRSLISLNYRKISNFTFYFFCSFQEKNLLNIWKETNLKILLLILNNGMLIIF